MHDRVVVAVFEHEDDLRAAAAEVRQRGLQIVDAYTPYAVHGLDQAMGLRPSRLTWVCFVCGLIGALGMLAFEYWTAAVNWAVDVGGKPWVSLPSDVPVAFEAAVLLAGFGSVFALLGVSRLYPGKRPRVLPHGVTDECFALLIDEGDASHDIESICELLEQHNVVEFDERLMFKGGELQ